MLIAPITSFLIVRVVTDNYGRTVGTFGGELSFEIFLYHSDFLQWQRTFVFSNNPVNAAGTVTSGATSDVIGLVTGPSGDTGYATDISYTNAVLQKNLTGVTWGRVGEWVSDRHIFSYHIFIISYHV